VSGQVGGDDGWWMFFNQYLTFTMRQSTMLFSNKKVKESSEHLQIVDAKLEKLKLEILLT
jgi:hypothetical protein